MFLVMTLRIKQCFLIELRMEKRYHSEPDISAKSDSSDKITAACAGGAAVCARTCSVNAMPIEKTAENAIAPEPIHSKSIETGSNPSAMIPERIPVAANCTNAIPSASPRVAAHPIT